jgi:hypothetical protein
MTSLGAAERKRRTKAMPPEAAPRLSAGCVAVMGVYLGACVLVAIIARSAIASVAALPVALGLGYAGIRYIRGRSLLAAVQREWAPRGVRCLIVHSDSRLWQEHVASIWLARWGAIAETLNWSERSAWEEESRSPGL